MVVADVAAIAQEAANAIGRIWLICSSLILFWACSSSGDVVSGVWSTSSAVLSATIDSIAANQAPLKIMLSFFSNDLPNIVLSVYHVVNLPESTRDHTSPATEIRPYLLVPQDHSRAPNKAAECSLVDCGNSKPGNRF